MFTIQDVRNILNDLDKISGMSSKDMTIEVKNTTKVLASCVHRVYRDCYGNVVKRQCVRFEVSKLILNCNYDTLKEVLKHEYAHFMSIQVYQDNCGHDSRFKEMCRRIGANFNEVSVSTTDIEEQSRKMAKYHVICDECGHIYTYNRMCKTLKDVKEGRKTVRCGCGCKDLTFKQNR